MLTALQRDPALCEAVRALLAGGPLPDAIAFYRLSAAGVLTGEAPQRARFRCRLYAEFLARRLT
jgi:hypothetical protein